VFLVLALTLFGVIATRERKSSGIRQTRATLLALRPALDAYLAENDGVCPESLDRVLDYSSFRKAPLDAWGRPLRLVCPGRREGERYELSSDGPDGEPGGLDRIE
jgi:general secretion pathway protein G